MSDNQQQFLSYVDTHVDGFIDRLTVAVSKERSVIPYCASITRIPHRLLV